MESAFGIDHGAFAKSLVNGEFKAASALTRGERAAMGGYKQARGVTPEHQAFKQTYHTQIVDAVKQNRANGLGLTKKGKILNHPDGNSGATFRTGGKNTGQSHIFGAAPNKHAGNYILAHESQHATPNRSAYRLHHQIAGNPEKLMREEGRADYRAGGHYKKHSDGGSVYAQGARAMDGLDRKGADAPFKFKGATKRQFKDAGMPVPKIPNRQAVDSVKTGIQAQLPHYQLSGEKGDSALRAYKGLHDSMKAKGVPAGKNRRVI